MSGAGGNRRHRMVYLRRAAHSVLARPTFVNPLGLLNSAYIVSPTNLGGMAACFAEFCQRKFGRGRKPIVTFGFVMAGAYLLHLPAPAWNHGVGIPRFVNVLIAFVVATLAAALALRYGSRVRRWCFALAAQAWPPSPRLIRRASLFLGAMLVGMLSVLVFMTATAPLTHGNPHWVSGNRPNFVFIALDTARADHFSAYGYSKPTTPNWDNLASKGVLFENAIAPAPWTLASFATVFTGLLPHQNQADWETPLADGDLTLTEILHSRGYQTAGFNANYIYGTARAGMAQGFDTYDDDDGSVATVLARTSITVTAGG